MPYSHQDLEALLQNDDYVRWVTGGKAEADAFWNEWVLAGPERRLLVEKSRELILMVRQVEQDEAAKLDSHHLAAMIWNEIQATPPRRARLRYLAAAAVLMLLGVGIWWLAAYMGDKSTVAEKGRGKEVLAQNTHTALRTVLLVDGSRVTLSPGASIRYQSLLGHERREVNLEGEAFFEVAQDAQKPFIVYSNGIITKVLGTSFRVTGGKQVMVAVKTGKVSVSGKSGEAYILSANQQVVFDDMQRKGLQTAVSNPALLDNPVTAPPPPSFDEAPFGAVIDTLSELYAVDIAYEKSLFTRCRVTVSLDQGSLFEQLNVLCKVVGAGYHVEDTVIHITGKGCR